MNDKKKMFLEALATSYGIIAPACKAVDVGRSTYYRWRDEDAEFREKADEIMEVQVDFVESKLMKQIDSGDTSSIIFYLKTKGKHRGYNEKALPKPQETPPRTAALPPRTSEDEAKAGRKRIEGKIRSKKTYIVKLLKQQGKYTEELAYQVDITAKLLVRADLLGDEILSDGHKAVNVEYSREGNERVTIDPKEKLYIELLEKGQRALRALGMNTESKERKTDNDDFGGFMAAMQEDDE